jgi:small GTP-binding protein
MDTIEIVKILLVGEDGVGKTSIRMKFADELYDENHKYIGIDFITKSVNLGSQEAKVQIWEDHPVEKMARWPYRRNFTILRQIHGFIFVYDVTNRNSFVQSDGYLHHFSEDTLREQCKLIIGNKCDIEDNISVSYDEGKSLADRFGVPFIETSAKTGLNIDQAFIQIISEILYRRASAKDMPDQVSKPWSVKNCILC